ncbi:MAG: AAA family ATPase [Deltaproteobacteria bacterium]|nr:AAA family ATPase [Deltaproteobacteria bacterium]MBW2254453.1 AAA family ATPase [Deltaproteobacteria bacterium]
MTAVEEVEARVAQVAPTFERARGEMGRVLVGQRYMVDRLLIGLLANGHVLVEGVPGLAKTTAVKCLAQSLHMEFSRIQFTPDLLPADVIGTQIYQPSNGEFTTRLGPVFTNVLLADEINRAPAKVQSALLECMEERQVTIGDNTYPLPNPFLVLATQNPIEQEGTYPLPEAQTDRFMLKLSVTYPELEEELEIIARSTHAPPVLNPVARAEEILEAQVLVQEIRVTDVLMRYIVDLVRATRHAGEVDGGLARAIDVGASPRASISLAAAARAHAFLDGRGYALPEDVKAIAPDVLRHRILLSYEAEADGLTTTDIIERILDNVDMP